MPMSLPILFLILLLLGFLGTALFTALLIPRLRAMKMGQRILEIGPVWHAPKEGTPTMGGLSFLLVTLLLLPLSPLLFDAYPSKELYAFLVSALFAVSNGAVGIVDDLTKLHHRRNEGLTPTQKLLLQVTLSAAYLAFLRTGGIIGEALSFPFFGAIPMGFASYFVLLLLLVGITNCANLTDGIDGLACGVASVIFAFYALLSARAEAAAPMLLSAVFLSVALAFLLFNRFPARIFMGDTGSLFLGAAAASVPILLDLPFFSLIAGIIYVIEGASVILQVIYFKKTKKRLFLMAPIHHHFEKCGYSENRIVLLFSTVTAAACALAWFLP